MRSGDKLPAPVIPTGTVCDLVQDKPLARLPADVRARVFPLIQQRPDWDGIVAIAGDGVHHWVHISAGEAISMLGFLTPQMISALGGADMPDLSAVADTLSHPERLAAHLRSAQLAGDAAALSGHLIGAELAAAKMYWLGQQIVVLDDGPYIEALRAQGAPVSTL